MQVNSNQGDLCLVAVLGDDGLRAAIGRGRKDMRAAGEIERHHRRARVRGVIVVPNRLRQHRDGPEQRSNNDGVLQN